MLALRDLDEVPLGTRQLAFDSLPTRRARGQCFFVNEKNDEVMWSESYDLLSGAEKPLKHKARLERRKRFLTVYLPWIAVVLLVVLAATLFGSGASSARGVGILLSGFTPALAAVLLIPKTAEISSLRAAEVARQTRVSERTETALLEAWKILTLEVLPAISVWHEAEHASMILHEDEEPPVPARDELLFVESRLRAVQSYLSLSSSIPVHRQSLKCDESMVEASIEDRQEHDGPPWPRWGLIFREVHVLELAILKELGHYVGNKAITTEFPFYQNPALRLHVAGPQHKGLVIPYST